ncbi:MAG: queuosine precursor transporter [Candidatus Eisenbacteria bacterium]|nr:queuosine precursor transporter [Candidatus Eisenbacteria bacterium]
MRHAGETAPGEDALRVLVGLFVAALVASNFVAAKLITVAGFTVPAAVLLFPLSYILGDVLTEVYGYAVARKTIWIGFACNVVVVAVTWATIVVPPSPVWTLAGFGTAGEAQSAYSAVLGFAPRIVLASLVAYLVGEFLNAAVLARLKVATSGRHLWVRTIGSTLVGQLADSAIFITIAFAGTVPWSVLGGIVLAQWLIKCGIEAAATPATYLVVARLKRLVGVDHFDEGVSLSPLRWKGARS